MTTTDFWIITLSIAIGTFLLRAVFIFIFDNANISERTQSLLKFIPPAVFAALVAPPIFLHQGQVDWLGGKERVIAAVVAALVALKLKNMIAVLIAGMGTLYLLMWLS